MDHQEFKELNHLPKMIEGEGRFRQHREEAIMKV